MSGLFRKNLIAALVILCLLLQTAPLSGAASDEATQNRFNVVIVLDGSGSMNQTDPNGLRFEAVRQFACLLAERGNLLGGVVFSDGIDARQDLTAVDSQESKDQIVDQLAAVQTNGNTNTGAALGEAVSMLKGSGDPSLPSVILFLSDGNTYMETEEEQQTSLDGKAEAIQDAREEGIQIFSVCLNANNAADISEFEQISEATGGAFEEVRQAEDLRDVFQMFYGLIYDTSAISLADGTFPSDGRLETRFDVPDFGVEEVNIAIYGQADIVALLRPDGTQAAAAQSVSETFTMLKLTEIVPGEWTLVTEGDPGDSVRITMVYNTNLGIELTADPDGDSIHTGDPLTVRAVLTSGTQKASRDEQYSGYSAELVTLDAYQNELDRKAMQVTDGAFARKLELDEGVYYYQVHVTGNGLDKDSETVGPLTVSDEAVAANTPPQPVQARIEETVTRFPFIDSSYVLDLTTLARDAEDSELLYTIESSSFREGEDYRVEQDILTLDHFSLSKGAFTIRATDSGGLSCDIEVVVRSVNVGLLMLLGLGAAALIVLAVLGVGLYLALSKPFRGTISVQSRCDGVYRGTPRTPKRGRCKLSAFGLDPVGLDYGKCYFQATGQPYIYLVTNKPVLWNGRMTEKVRVQSGAEVIVSPREGDPRQLFIRFTSRMRGKPRRRPSKPRPGSGPSRRPSAGR